MSETIIAVIIGGLLTGSGTWIANWMQFKKWKTEQKIRILENKRMRIENLAGKTLEELSEGIDKNSYNIEMMSNIQILFPDNVNAKFQEFMSKKVKDDLDKKGGFFEISLEIKKALKEIDNEIERLL